MSEALLLPGTGELNRRIVIRLWTDVPNTDFGVDARFDAGIIRWAKVEPIRGLSMRLGMNTEEEPTHFFWVRFSFATPAEYFAQNRVIEYRGRRFRILEAQDFQDVHRFIRITAKDLGAMDTAATDFAGSTNPYVPGLGI